MKHLKALVIFVLLLSMLTGCAPSQEQQYKITTQALEELNANSYFGGHHLGEPASVSQALFEEAGGWPTRQNPDGSTSIIWSQGIDMNVWVPNDNWLFNYNGIYGGGGAYPADSEQDSLTYLNISSRAFRTDWQVYGITASTLYKDAKEILLDVGFENLNKQSPFYKWFKDYINLHYPANRQEVREYFFIKGNIILYLQHFSGDKEKTFNIAIILCDPENTEYLENIQKHLSGGSL